jgi:hypothetical protein
LRVRFYEFAIIIINFIIRSTHMRTFFITLGLAFAANTIVLAQQKDIAGNDTRDRVAVPAIATKGSSRHASAATKGVDMKIAAMPTVNYYTIAEGEDEDFPPGLYATFLPTAPDTVKVFEEESKSYHTYTINAGREMIHGDSASVFSEVGLRKDAYAGMGQMPTKRSSFVTRSGYIPIDQFGQDRFTFAVKPSHFRIAPGATISASVQIEGDEDLSSFLCTVSAIDYEQNTFTVEISRKVPIGETINWIIVNFPE